MNELLVKNQNIALSPMEHKNQRIIITKFLAEQFGTEDRRMTENYQRNKERFIEGKHFYKLEGEELRDFKANTLLEGNLKFAPELFLWTERGAARHAKILETDEAWEVYEQLEETYFKVKEKSVDTSNLPPELQLFKQIFDSQAKMYLEQKRLENLALEAKQEAESVNEKFTAVKETFAEHRTDDWRKWVNSTFAKMNVKTGRSYSELKNDSYELLGDRTGVKLAIRVNNQRDRLKETGATKAIIEAYVTLSAIEDDKKLKELYTGILKEMSVRFLI